MKNPRYAILSLLLSFALIAFAQVKEEVVASKHTTRVTNIQWEEAGPGPGVNGEYRSPMAVKTNLLSDLATLLNIEMEYRLSAHWSVMAEGSFSWWNIDHYKYSLHTNFGLAEVRYYLGRRLGNSPPPATHWTQNRPQGWFLGVHAGAGRFGITYPSEGYMGDLVVTAGLSVGFTHPVSRYFSMEYCVGVGVVMSNYQYFLVQDNGKRLLWQYDARYQGLLPTRAKVSLVWWPRFGSRKKGARL